MNIDRAREVADAVLYEGYLLYPYRASSSKNQSRWQFGVLSPPDALKAGLDEDASMSMQCILDSAVSSDSPPTLLFHLRFLQLQRRQVLDEHGEEVSGLESGGESWISWDEAIEQELAIPASLADLAQGFTHPVAVDGGEDVEVLKAEDGATIGHIARRRWPLAAHVSARITRLGTYLRLEVGVENVHTEPSANKDESIRHSFIGTHLMIEAHGTDFVSLLEPPDGARDAVAQCAQRRCWPVLAGEPGDTDLLLGLPIILYDYPEIAAESAGALFDATEIDEILTLRVLTMTDAEKAEARATDPRAREIIDRCDEMTPETLQQLHGVLRSPHTGESGGPPEVEWPGLSDIREVDPPTFETGDVPWWDPEADAAVRPEADAVTIDGISVSKGSLVRVHPNRRADAQDLFFADQIARVTAVLSDVDGGTHVALVLVDDPAADMHEWYGRYFYFAPDELEPMPVDSTTREESRP